MFGGYHRTTRTRDSPAAKGRPLAAGTAERKVLGARRAVLASKHSLQPGELAGGVAQATTHVQPIFTASNRAFAQFSTIQVKGAASVCPRGHHFWPFVSLAGVTSCRGPATILG
jgi:hypothetical protein